MRLKDADKFEAYPRFRSWLFGLAERVRGNPKVLNALMRFGKLSKQDAYVALMLPLTPPSLDLNSFWNPKGRLRYALSIYHNETDLVILNQGMAVLFESDASWGRVIEASILHELVHRGLMIAGDPNAEHDDVRDRGAAFERAAYGDIVEASCSQEIALRRVTSNWRPGVSGVFNYYDYQCGIETTPGKSRIYPY